MARVFITGSADGLGRAAAQTLLDHGHEVVIHVRDRDRLTAVRDLVDAGADWRRRSAGMRPLLARALKFEAVSGANGSVRGSAGALPGAPHGAVHR